MGFASSPLRQKLPLGMDSFAQYGDGPSSVATLQPHPFNVLISDFQQRRQTATTKKQAAIGDFLTAFKSQMKELDSQYYQQKQQIQEQIHASQIKQPSVDSHIPAPAHYHV